MNNVAEQEERDRSKILNQTARAVTTCGVRVYVRVHCSMLEIPNFLPHLNFLAKMSDTIEDERTTLFANEIYLLQRLVVLVLNM